MTCPNENRLIRLLGGELPDNDRVEIVAHLQNCEACRSRHSELQHTWELLGQLEAVPPLRDLAPAVLAAAREETERSSRLYWARLVAAVALAIGAGSAIGLLQQRTSPLAAVHADVTADDVVQVIGIDSLETDSTVLSGLLLSEQAPTTAGEEGEL